jgi:excisionase family DNA binding protein
MVRRIPSGPSTHRRTGVEKLLLRPMEAAESIAVSKSKIYELLASGSIPSVRIGKSIRIPREELKKWVDSQLTQATEQAKEGSDST